MTEKSLAAVRKFLGDFEITAIEDTDLGDADAGVQLARRRQKIDRALVWEQAGSLGGCCVTRWAFRRVRTRCC